MTITIVQGDPREAQATALLTASHALMQSLFPPEENYFLSIDVLCAPDILFYVAMDNTRIQGCAALAIKDGYAEVKSMFVAPETRGKGIADALLSHLATEARARSIARLKLETGDALEAAIRLYERHGFRRCGPFGDYEENTSSVFMERSLA